MISDNVKSGTSIPFEKLDIFEPAEP